MKRKFTGIFALIFCLITLLSISVASALANSAQANVEGVDMTGAVMPDNESPIIVEKELLTFDISEFPDYDYSAYNLDEFLSYSARVTAEYTFYNPSEYAVKAKLLFPFGELPSYAYGYHDGEGNFSRFDDTAKYDVTVNGAPIEKKIRHTLSTSYDFDVEEDLKLIKDDFASNDFYKPDTTVTKYTFVVNGIDPKNYYSAHIGFDLKEWTQGYRIYFPDNNSIKMLDNGNMRVCTSGLKNGTAFSLFVIGEPFATIPEWKVYKNGGVNDDEVIFGSAKLIDTKTLTFKDFALSNRPEGSIVSDIDWYNALLAEINKDYSYDSRYPLIKASYFAEGFDDSLMRWYEYEITLEPNERIVNAVTAPMYPTMDTRYEPAVHEYTYLLSPAKTWKEFGALDIKINTPYYLNDSSLEGFTKVEGGYSLSLDGLPNGELTFRLSESENPVKHVYKWDDRNDSSNYLTIVAICMLVFMGLIFVGGILTTYFVCKKTRNKQNTQK